jgi:uncharacterized SAM-binding protein YcdF (DUF218 family)
MKRLVVVLGYSDGRRKELHPICAARLERAALVAEPGDAVVLTGWARRPGRVPEAELMRAAWPGPERSFIVDTQARITAENVAYVAGLVDELGSEEVVVVTSWWHRRRTQLLLRTLLGGRPVRVSVLGVERPWSVRLLAREVACFALVPFQVRRARAG